MVRHGTIPSPILDVASWVEAVPEVSFGKSIREVRLLERVDKAREEHARCPYMAMAIRIA
jgi:hypothetical protein